MTPPWQKVLEKSNRCCRKDFTPSKSMVWKFSWLKTAGCLG